jgi:hypothetical protein
VAQETPPVQPDQASSSPRLTPRLRHVLLKPKCVMAVALTRLVKRPVDGCRETRYRSRRSQRVPVRVKAEDVRDFSADWKDRSNRR